MSHGEGRRELRQPGLARGREVTFVFAGEPVRGYEGESVAMALWAAQHRCVRQSSRAGEPRGVFCNMGVCFECLVRTGGLTVRSCLLPVREGLVVEPGGRP
jgi:D-hydroxyproline dehydrogenase subunit gamma